MDEVPSIFVRVSIGETLTAREGLDGTGNLRQFEEFVEYPILPPPLLIHARRNDRGRYNDAI